ncbi:MAG TPA: hypothetical protein VF422_04205 [Dokdonella sp.]
MSNRLRFVLPALLAVAAFAFAPVAFARSHWSVGVNLGFPGVSIGYADYGHRGHGWGGNYYYGGYYGGYHASRHYHGSYYGPSWYGAGYYAPIYYGPRYYGYGGAYYYSRPAASVVYYDREPPRRYREVRRYEERGYQDDGYYRESRHGRRATYYDRDADYRR